MRRIGWFLGSVVTGCMIFTIVGAIDKSDSTAWMSDPAPLIFILGFSALLANGGRVGNP